MFQWILGAVVVPLLFMVFNHYYDKSPGDWVPAILAAVVAFGGLWAVKGLLDWEEANGGDTGLTFIGKMLGMMAFAYGGIVAFGLGSAALTSSKESGAPPD